MEDRDFSMEDRDFTGLHLKERGFDMAFGFLNNEIPREIGSWNIYY
jgi:hypothetical protein